MLKAFNRLNEKGKPEKQAHNKHQQFYVRDKQRYWERYDAGWLEWRCCKTAASGRTLIALAV